MLLTHGACAAVHPPVALTIGNFDGVHRGHQAMIASLRAEARKRGLMSCALTFEPHPLEYFERVECASRGRASRPAPVRLTSLREKCELLEANGVERVHVQRFNRALAALTPEAFVAQVLVERLKTRWVLIGDDFRFGAKRAGDIALLRQLAARWNFEVETMTTVTHDGVRVSSSKARDALAAGDLAAAEALLGRTYSISGRVIHGKKLGRELGFATANVQLKHNRPPLTGIYAVRLRDAGGQARPGVASLGVRPTITASGRAVLEVHLFDFAGDLYGEHVRVEFLRKIRDEEKYSDIEIMKAQIARDCEIARNILLEYGNV